VLEVGTIWFQPPPEGGERGGGRSVWDDPLHTQTHTHRQQSPVGPPTVNTCLTIVMWCIASSRPGGQATVRQYLLNLLAYSVHRETDEITLYRVFVKTMFFPQLFTNV
jgi:hypothetical protein